MIDLYDMFILAALAVVCMLTAGFAWAINRRQYEAHPFRGIMRVCFVYYMAAVLFLTMRPSPVDKAITLRLIPLSTIVSLVRSVSCGMLDLATFLYNILGNALMLLPMGLLLPAIWPVFRRFWLCLLVCAVASVMIEAAQFIFTYLHLLNRTVDIDDVILNTLGSAAGYGLYRIVCPAFWRQAKAGT